MISINKNNNIVNYYIAQADTITRIAERGIVFSDENPGFIVAVCKEEMLVLILDLQRFNKGSSVTNCVEYIADALEANGSLKPHSIDSYRFIEIDSSGYFDEVVLIRENPLKPMSKGWTPLGHRWENLATPRTFESFVFFYKDRAEEYLMGFRQVAKNLGLSVSVVSGDLPNMGKRVLVDDTRQTL